MKKVILLLAFIVSIVIQLANRVFFLPFLWRRLDTHREFFNEWKWNISQDYFVAIIMTWAYLLWDYSGMWAYIVATIYFLLKDLVFFSKTIIR